jgi:1-acyl-sn-glycerol-3-phosphate acyltransferase
MRFQRFARGVFRALFGILLKCQVTGLENVPRQGPLIVVMNHINFLDPILVSVVIPRDIAIMSKVENMEAPILGTLADWYGAFPVRRGEVDLSAVRNSLRALQGGKALLLAPEGTRSQTARLQKGQDGTALIAFRAKAPLLPVALSGNEGFAENVKRLRRTPTQIAIGEPFLLTYPGKRPSREELSHMTDEIMYRIAALLPPAYRGQFSDLSQTTARYARPLAAASAEAV